MASGMSNFNIKKSFVWKYGLSRLHKKKSGDDSDSGMPADDASSCCSLEPDLELRPQWEPLVAPAGSLWQPPADPAIPDKRRSAHSSAASCDDEHEPTLPGYDVAGCRRVPTADGEHPIYETLSEYGGPQLADDQQTLYENDDTDEELAAPLYENGDLYENDAPYESASLYENGPHGQPIYANGDVDDEPPIYENLGTDEESAATEPPGDGRNVYDDLRVEVRSDLGYDSHQSPSSDSAGSSPPKLSPNSDGVDRGEIESAESEAEVEVERVPSEALHGHSQRSPLSRTKMLSLDPTHVSRSGQTPRSSPSQTKKSSPDQTQRLSPGQPRRSALSQTQKSSPGQIHRAPSGHLPGAPMSLTSLISAESLMNAKQALKQCRGQQVVRPLGVHQAKAKPAVSRYRSDGGSSTLTPGSGDTTMPSKSGNKPCRARQAGRASKQAGVWSADVAVKSSESMLTSLMQNDAETRQRDSAEKSDTPRQNSSFLHSSRLAKSVDNAGFQLARKAIAQALQMERPHECTERHKVKRTAPVSFKMSPQSDLAAPVERIAVTPGFIPPPPPLPSHVPGGCPRGLGVTPLRASEVVSPPPAGVVSPPPAGVVSPTVAADICLSPTGTSLMLLPPPSPASAPPPPPGVVHPPSAAVPSSLTMVVPSTLSGISHSTPSGGIPSSPPLSTKISDGTNRPLSSTGMSFSSQLFQTDLKKKVETKKNNMATGKAPSKKKRMAPKPPDRSFSLPGFGSSKVDILKAFEEFKQNEESNKRTEHSKKKKKKRENFLDELDLSISKKNMTKQSGKETPATVHQSVPTAQPKGSVQLLSEDRLDRPVKESYASNNQEVVPLKHPADAHDCKQSVRPSRRSLQFIISNTKQAVRKKLSHESDGATATDLPKRDNSAEAHQNIEAVEATCNVSTTMFENVGDSSELTVLECIGSFPSSQPPASGHCRSPPSVFFGGSLTAPEKTASAASVSVCTAKASRNAATAGTTALQADPSGVSVDLNASQVNFGAVPASLSVAQVGFDAASSSLNVTTVACDVTVGGPQVIHIARGDVPDGVAVPLPLSLTVAADPAGRAADTGDRVALQVTHSPTAPARGGCHTSLVSVETGAGRTAPRRQNSADSPADRVDLVGPLVISVTEVERQLEILEQDRWKELAAGGRPDREKTPQKRADSKSRHSHTVVEIAKKGVDALSIIDNKEKTKHFLERRIQADLTAGDSGGPGRPVTARVSAADGPPRPSCGQCDSRRRPPDQAVGDPRPAAPETRIAREIRELRCREEELRRARAATGQLHPAGLASLDETLSGYGSDDKESLAENVSSTRDASAPMASDVHHQRSRSQESHSSGLSSSHSSGHSPAPSSDHTTTDTSGRRRVTVRPYDDQEIADQWSSRTRSTETPIEREIRLTREREEERRREQALAGTLGSSATSTGQQQTTTGHRTVSQSTPADQGAPEGRPTALRLATGRVQHEIREASRRELELRGEANTITTSQRTPDEKVTRLGAMTTHSLKLSRPWSDPAPKRQLTTARPAPAAARPAPAAAGPAPAAARPVPPAAPAILRPRPAGVGGGRGLMQKFISSRGKLRPLSAFSTEFAAVQNAPRCGPIPLSATPSTRPATNGWGGTADTTGKHQHNTTKHQQVRGVDTTGKHQHNSTKHQQVRGVDTTGKQQHIATNRQQAERCTAGPTANRRILTAEEKIQLELKIMKDREDELRRERTWALARSQPDLLAALQGDDSAEEEELTPAPGTLCRTMSNPNLLDDPDQQISGTMANGRRRSVLIDQWESRIQGTDY